MSFKKQTGLTIQEKFEEFHRLNPRVYEQFVMFAAEPIAKGKKTSAKLIEAAVNIFYELRDRGFEKPPATSELINWIGALESTGQIPDPQMPPLTGILLKRAGDIQNYRRGGQPQSGNKQRYPY